VLRQILDQAIHIPPFPRHTAGRLRNRNAKHALDAPVRCLLLEL
jgi:hypothetical protein